MQKREYNQILTAQLAYIYALVFLMFYATHNKTYVTHNKLLRERNRAKTAPPATTGAEKTKRIPQSSTQEPRLARHKTTTARAWFEYNNQGVRTRKVGLRGGGRVEYFMTVTS